MQHQRKEEKGKLNEKL